MLIERKTIGIAQEVTLGEPCEINMTVGFKKAAEALAIANIRPQRLVTNVDGPDIVYLAQAFFGEKEVLGGDVIDAYCWNPNAIGVHIDAGRVEGDVLIRIVGRYTGLVPRWGKTGEKFTFTLAVTGPCDTPENY